MPLKPIDALEPGVVLATPVYDDAGRLLIPEGRPLTERQIQRLSGWGIHEVDVAEAEAEEEEEELVLDPELLARAEEVVAPRFVLQPVEHRLIRETRALAVLQWATKESRAGRSASSTRRGSNP